MAGLNFVTRVNNTDAYTTDRGDMVRVYANSLLELEITKDTNGVPHLREVRDVNDGEICDEQTPFSDENSNMRGYVGTSLTQVGEDEYVISLGTPDFAFSVPFGEWALAQAKRGSGMLRADEEADVSGEAAAILTKALEYIQVGIEPGAARLALRETTSRGIDIKYVLPKAIDSARGQCWDVGYQVSLQFSISEAEVISRVMRGLYAFPGDESQLEEEARRIARQYGQERLAEAKKAVKAETLEEENSRTRSKRDALQKAHERDVAHKREIEARVEELEAELEEARKTDLAKLTKIDLVKALREKGLGLREARDIIVDALG
mgnify:CR=1 FL=1